MDDGDPKMKASNRPICDGQEGRQRPGDAAAAVQETWNDKNDIIMKIGPNKRPSGGGKCAPIELL